MSEGRSIVTRVGTGNWEGVSVQRSTLILLRSFCLIAPLCALRVYLPACLHAHCTRRLGTVLMRLPPMARAACTGTHGACLHTSVLAPHSTHAWNVKWCMNEFEMYIVYPARSTTIGLF